MRNKISIDKKITQNLIFLYILSMSTLEKVKVLTNC